jgi:pyruvate dehydrogenase (quinone)
LLPIELNLVGDSRATLAALLPRLQQKADRSWREDIEAKVARWWRVLHERAMPPAEPINPQRVFWNSRRAFRTPVLTCDSSTAATWHARDLQFRRGMMGSLSGGLATMGPALPYALAAKHAHPDRPVLALLGDGAMQMLGINALITVAASWRHWTDPRLVIMVLNNGDLNIVTWEQRATAGDPKFEPSQNLPPFAYAEVAKQLGLGGLRVDDLAQVGAAGTKPSPHGRRCCWKW